MSCPGLMSGDHEVQGRWASEPFFVRHFRLRSSFDMSQIHKAQNPSKARPSAPSETFSDEYPRVGISAAKTKQAPITPVTRAAGTRRNIIKALKVRNRNQNAGREAPQGAPHSGHSSRGPSNSVPQLGHGWTSRGVVCALMKGAGEIGKLSIRLQNSKR